jgi:hypothetical protein
VVGWLYEGAGYWRSARFDNGNVRLLAVGLDTGECSFCYWQHEVAGCGTGYWRGARFVTGNMRLLAVGLDTGGVLVL